MRRGAWYPLVALTKTEAVLEAGHRRVRLPIQVVQVTNTRPDTWTIVKRPPDAKGSVALWADACYLCCPNCGTRARLRGSQRAHQCARCEGDYHIGWDEWYTAPA